MPVDSVQDWVTYGDHLAAFTISSVRTGEPDPAERERGEGTLSRTMTISIDEPVWTRPTASADLELPTSLTTGAGFYFFQGDERRRALVDGRPWLEQGERYLAIFNLMDPTFEHRERPPGPAHAVWGPLAWMHLSGDRVDQVANGEDSSVVALKSMTVDEVAAVLAATEPDPRALPYMDEDPALRYQHTNR